VELVKVYPFDRFAFRKALDNHIEGQKDAAASMIFQSLMRQLLAYYGKNLDPICY